MNDKELRVVAMERSACRCEYPGCLTPFGDWRGLALHHKDAKGMGGTKRVYELKDVEILCAKHHNLRHGIREVRE